MLKLSELYDRTINLYSRTKTGYSRPSIAGSYISIKKYDPMFSISSDKSSVDEGTMIRFDVHGFNVKNGTTVYYKIVGCAASDFEDGSLTGTCMITAGTGFFTKTLVADLTTEGTEQFTVELRTSVNGRVIKYLTPVSIEDMSVTPVPIYSVVATPTSTDESGSISFNWSVTNSIGAALTWEITGVQIADFTDGLGLSGSLTGTSGTVTKILSQDQLTEGLETITFNFKAVGGIVATCTCAVGDSSISIPCKSVGTPVVLKSQPTAAISITTLTEFKTLVAYRHQTGPSDFSASACVLDISGSTVTCGTPVVFKVGNADSMSVVRITDTKAIMVYVDYGNDNHGTARIINISGSTITYGESVIFSQSSATFPNITLLTDTVAVVAYSDADGRYARVLNISGSTITCSTPVRFTTLSCVDIHITRLTDTKAIVAYQDSGTFKYGRAVLLNISGSTITCGTQVVFEASEYAQVISIDRLTDTKAIVTYSDYSNSRCGTVCVLNVSDSTLTCDVPVVFDSAVVLYTSVSRLTDTTAVVTYQGAPGYGYSRVLNISGSIVTYNTPVVFEYANVYDISVTRLTDAKAIVAYVDQGNSNYGTACVLY